MKKLVLFSVGMLAFTVANAQNTTLFTTYNDFSQWSANAGDSISSDNTFSVDTRTNNGVGNTSAPGGNGTSGSLSIQWTPSVGNFNDLANAPGEGGNAAFLQTIDPGSDGVNAVTYSGNLYFDYSLPDNEGGSYFQLGVLLQYQGDGYYGTYFSSSVSDLGFQDGNGEEVFQATVPYSITGGSAFNGFGFGIMYNGNFSPALPLHVDDVFVPTVATPEPGTLALMGLGFAGLALIRRRR